MPSIDEFAAYDVRQMEVWLADRLALRAEAPQIDRNALCDFRGVGVRFGDSYLDSIVNLFGELPLPSQEAFRRALADLLRHATAEDFSVNGMSDLIYLIGMTRSHPGLLAFVPVLGAGGWAGHHAELMYDAFAALLMFDRANEAYVAARALVTSAHFVDRFVFDAYSILLRSRPDAWQVDLALIAPRLNRLISAIVREGRPEGLKNLMVMERRLARELVMFVPRASLSEGLNRIDLGTVSGRRLVRSLFVEEPRLLEVWSDGTGYLLGDPKEPVRETAFVVSPKLLVAMQKWRVIKTGRIGKTKLSLGKAFNAAFISRLGHLQSPGDRRLADAHV